MRAKLFIMIISVSIVITAIEVILRVAWINPYKGTSADKILKLKLHNNNLNKTFNRSLVDKVVPEISFRTDDRGYIKPSFRFDDPDFTVVFMGGSTTECAAVQEKKRFPYLVSKYIEAKGLKVNTLNTARSGGTLHDSINMLFNYVVLDHCDMIVLMHAVNDIAVISKDKSYSSRMGHDISLIDIVRYSSQLMSVHSSLCGFLRQKVRKPNFSPIDYPELKGEKCEIDSSPFISRIIIFIEMCRAFGIIPVLVTQPLNMNLRNELTPRWANESCQKLFNDRIRNVSKNKNVYLIDLSSFITKKAFDNLELKNIFYDGMHVTDYGSKIYAKYISNKVYNILNEKLLKAEQDPK